MIPGAAPIRQTYLYAALFALVASVWLVALPIHSWVGIDFYPLYFAALRIREGLSPYGPEATARLAQEWPAMFAAAGVAYPLPLLALVVPLTLLPFGYAAGVWIGLGLAGGFGALRLGPAWRPLALLPLLFLPFHRNAALGQATLLWFGLAAVLILAIQARKPWVVGVVSAVLLLKPQSGLFFALAGLVWAAASERRALWWFGGACLGLGALSFLLQPGWLGAWLEQVRVYSTVVRLPGFQPLGLLLLLACWRLPWWARVAVAQVVFFPLYDPYLTLPLLFCWIGVGGPLALAGAGLSWIWIFGDLPNSPVALWMLIMLPLGLAALWRTRHEPWRKTAGRRSPVADR